MDHFGNPFPSSKFSFSKSNEELPDHHGNPNQSALLERCRRDNSLDAQFCFRRINDEHSEQTRLGWLINVQPTLLENKESNQVYSCVDLYFIEQDGSTFKAALQYHPYFYLIVRPNKIREVEGYLQRNFDSYIHEIEIQKKTNLDMKDHLIGAKETCLRVKFSTVQDLVACRNILLQSIQSRRGSIGTHAAYGDIVTEYGNDQEVLNGKLNDSTYIEDIREYDIPYYQRVMIDMNVRVSNWYRVQFAHGKLSIEHQSELQLRPQPKVLAFDIECTKLPLMFPDPKTDQVMMISYMIDGQGYLIINRAHVSADIEPFEYTPHPDLKGHFMVWNEKNELALLQRFIEHVKEENPCIFVTFNGDYFDWKFLEERYKQNRIPLSDSINLKYHERDEYYSTPHACHLDVFSWVRRDSYLPQGSQGLKSVTKHKLGYDPLEIDPELMVSYALTRPTQMAQYSVSDAVATYYLYMKYVHPFIFSLCAIVPMHPDDVLRKGTGTLCESLLMVEATKLSIIFPNKKKQETDKMFNGHLIESETYIGGHVDALVSGVYRSDLPLDFTVDRSLICQLIDLTEKILEFTITVENHLEVDQVLNYDELKTSIVAQLRAFLQASDRRHEEPNIYHVDVAAMYPNIILTNRLQPSSVVDDSKCSTCVFNQPENRCKRVMHWQQRVDYYPSTRAEYEQIKSQLEVEMFPNKKQDGGLVHYFQLPETEREEILRARLKKYCSTVYKKSHVTAVVEREDIVCMRENPFYVDTVLNFRNRRYIYRTKSKEWNQIFQDAKRLGQAEKMIEASQMSVLYDSLQLAHKCILNSFYGYVMRKGARWYSMEMAGIVTHVGALIIKRSRELIEKIGKPLELDTDGIWCCLPKSFPDRFRLAVRNDAEPKTVPFNFLCSVLNMMVHGEFSNAQYQLLLDPQTLEYSVHKECTIFFEIDGPYKAMVLPSSIQEGKQVKKRYAVFGFDNQLHELKGFELKRRGELQAVKQFQSEIFETFLRGTSLQEAYAAAASVAEYYLDILDSRALTLRDQELLELLSESRTMSRNLENYKGVKNSSITAAKRLTEFLGASSTSGKGLNCQFIICRKPANKSVTERAIPVKIFSANKSVQIRFIRRWCDDYSMTSTDLRDILDWEYYSARLSTQFQKLITLPANFQGLENPLKRVPHPSWLLKKTRQGSSAKQQLLTHLLAASDKRTAEFSCARTAEGSQTSLAIDGAEKECDRLVDLEDIDRAVHPIGRSAKGPSPPVAIETTQPSLSLVGADTPPPEPPARKRSRRATPTGADEERLDILKIIGPAPSESEQELEWLAWHKKKWRLELARRKRRKCQVGPQDPVQPSPTRLESFVLRMSDPLLEHPWSILKVTETDRPGVLKLWLVTPDQRLHQTYFCMPRIFYINSYTPCDEFSELQVQSVLPRSRPRHRLYKVDIPEEQYLEKRREIEIQQESISIEGIYESNVPPVFRTIVELGCLCRVKADHRRHNPVEPWELSQLETLAPSREVPYLPLPRPKFLYFYQVDILRDVMLGFYDPHEQSAAVFYTSPQSQGNLSHSLRKLSGTSQDISFDFRHHQHQAELYEASSRYLERYKQRLQTPGVVICQCSMPWTKLTSVLYPLLNLPSISMNFNQQDRNVPSLQWLSNICTLFVRRMLQVSEWYAMAVELASYAQVPLGNFTPDFAIFLSDVMFARKLKSMDHVWWYSEGPLPDLGSGCQAEYDESFDLSMNLRKCYPNCVETMSIELDLKGLAVNAVLQSHHIPDFESATWILNNDSSAPHGNEKETHNNSNSECHKDVLATSAALPLTCRPLNDPVLVCIGSFKAVKSMLIAWSVDTTVFGSAADLLISNFFRWLSSPCSRFYDPALHYLVNTLIKKVYLLLLPELQSLGCRVLCASLHKIILASDKLSRHEVFVYYEFLKKAFKRNREIFRYIEFELVRLYDIFLFKDFHNFVGISAAEDAGDDTSDARTAELAGSARGESLNRTDSCNQSPSSPGILSNQTPQEFVATAAHSSAGDEDEPTKKAASTQSTEALDRLTPIFCLHLAELFPQPVKEHLTSLLWLFILELFKQKRSMLRAAKLSSNAFLAEARRLRFAQEDDVEERAQSTDLITEYYSSVDPSYENFEKQQELSKKFEVFQPTSSCTEQQLTSVLAENLFRITQDIQHLVDESSEEWPKHRLLSFLATASDVSHVRSKNHLALEFVKVACYFLALKRSIQVQVVTIRRDLFKLLCYKEFAYNTELKNSGESCVLPDVVCDYCNFCQDLDLLQDERIMAGRWDCPTCSSPYERGFIEQRLIETIQREAIAHLMQEPWCRNCAEVRTGLMTTRCESCSGELRFRRSYSDLQIRLSTLRMVGELHCMSRLVDVVVFFDSRQK